MKKGKKLKMEDKMKIIKKSNAAFLPFHNKKRNGEEGLKKKKGGNFFPPERKRGKGGLFSPYNTAKQKRGRGGEIKGRNKGKKG